MFTTETYPKVPHLHLLNTSKDSDSTNSYEQPVPKPDHSFSEQNFPNIQLKPAIIQLEAIFS